MPRVVETATIGVDAETLWSEIGGFGSVGHWHPLLESVDTFGDEVGAVRITHRKSGTVQRERLQAYDSKAHLYRYRLEQTRMPVLKYTGEFRIDPLGSSGSASTVTWSVEVELAANADGDGRIVESVRRYLHAGIEGLCHKFTP